MCYVKYCTIYRVVYTILWILTIVAFSIPWARFDSEVYTGWRLLILIPFSIIMYAYPLGILIGLTILISWSSNIVKLTIAAGGLMIIGLAGAFPVYIAAEIFHKVSIELGIGLAFTASVLYIVGGTCIGIAVMKKCKRNLV